MERNTSYFRILLLATIVFLMFFFAHTLLAIDNNGPEGFPAEFLDRVGHKLDREWDRQGRKMTNSIFESLTEISLFEREGSGGFRFGIDVQRRVFSNFDIRDTWTVVDFFSVTGSYPLLLDKAIEVGPLKSAAIIETTIGLEVLNFRQVLATNAKRADFSNPQIATLPRYTDLEEPRSMQEIINHEDVKRIQKLDENVDENTPPLYLIRPPEEDDVDDDDTIFDGIASIIFFKSQNPEIIARFRNFLNLLTHPFLRVPLTKNAVERMEVGEVSSYTLSGALEISIAVGFGTINTNLDDNIELGVGDRNVFQGDFRISVLKESEHIMKVKYHRVYSYTNEPWFGGQEKDVVLFKGFSVLSSRIGRWRTQIVPFSFKMPFYYARSFDVGYSFDMRNPKAKQAYYAATVGNFGLAHDLFIEKEGVNFAFSRKQDIRGSSFEYLMRLAFLFESGSSTHAEVREAVITFPDGKKEVITVEHNNSRGFNTAFGPEEESRYRFLTDIDKNVYQETDDKGLSLRMSINIEDDWTTSKEMFQYIHEIESAVGIYGIFERPPTVGPYLRCPRGKEAPHKRPYTRSDGCGVKQRLKSLGRSRFYTRIGYNREQLERFAYRTSAEKWNIIEEAFGLPQGTWSSNERRTRFKVLHSLETIASLPLAIIDLYFENGINIYSAESFKKHWDRIGRINNYKGLVEEIEKIFKTRFFSSAYLKILRIAIGLDDEVDFFIHGHSSNNIFKTVTKSNSNVDMTDELSKRVEDEVDFDKVGGRRRIDQTAIIENMNADVINRDKVKISFILPKKPKFLHFRLDRSTNFRKYRILEQFTVGNEKYFKKGYNEIIINRGDEKGIPGALAKYIFNGHHHTLRIAISLQKDKWGPYTHRRFKVK